MMETYKTIGQLKGETKSLLRGNWGEAVKLNLIPTILNIISLVVVGFIFIILIALGIFIFNEVITDGSTSYSNIGSDMIWENTYSDTYSGSDVSFSDGPWSFIIGALVSLISIGISFTFLDWHRNRELQINPFRDAFRIFSKRHFISVIILYILEKIFIFLWSLLFVIPGIIKSLSYSQSYFIYKDMEESDDNEDTRGIDYITESRKLMDGHKGRYFLLKLSFIGWDIVGIITLGIGYLWIDPYKNATYAAFYNDLAKDRYLKKNFEY